MKVSCPTGVVLQAASYLGDQYCCAVQEAQLKRCIPKVQSLQRKAVSPAASEDPLGAVCEPRAVPGCQICRPGCSDVPGPSEQARAHSPSLPGHKEPSQLSSVPVAWQLCVWEGEEPWGERWVAFLPQFANAQQPTSPLPLFRGAFWQLQSFLQARKSRFVAIYSKIPSGARTGLVAPMLLQTSLR